MPGVIEANEEFGRAQRYNKNFNKLVTEDAMRIIREFTRTQSVSSAARTSTLDDSNESLTPSEREILDDGKPPTDDERLKQVLK